MSDGRLLEVGPAHGAFALQASEGGFDVTTIEMDERCCRHLESVVGVTAIHSDRPDDAIAAPGVVALYEPLLQELIGEPAP